MKINTVQEKVKIKHKALLWIGFYQVENIKPEPFLSIKVSLGTKRFV